MPTQSTVPVTSGSGNNIDTWTTATAGNKRQAVVLGDPSTDANVAAVTASNALKVDGSAVTQPVSASALPLPSGASTAAKQPALGTAGSASSDVLSVQGIASMTPLSVSGTVTATAGTNLNTSALALETGGNLATLAGAVSSSKYQVQVNSAVIPSATVMQSAATGNGNGTTLPTAGYATAVLNIVSSVTMGGGTTITFEASVDGTTWVPITGQLIGTNRFSTTAIGDGDYRISISGYNNLRARISAYSAGTTTVKGYVVALPHAQKTVQSIKPKLTQLSSAATPITTNTNTSVIAAPSAGNHLKIYRIFAQNSSATGTWMYWTEGSGGTKKVPWYLSQYQPMMENLEGSWELPTATALFINTATTGANIEWRVVYETVLD